MDNEIQLFKKLWDEAVRALPADKERSQTKAFLDSGCAKPILFDGELLIIAFRYNYQCAVFTQPENMRLVEMVILSILSHVPQILCMFDKGGNHFEAETEPYQKFLEVRGRTQ